MIGAQHARPFAQLLNRAYSRAGRAQKVRGKDGCRRAAQIAGGDFLDEFWNIDMGWTGVGARRIVTVQTAVRLNGRLIRGQGRQLLGKRLPDISHCQFHPSAPCKTLDLYSIKAVFGAINSTYRELPVGLACLERDTQFSAYTMRRVKPGFFCSLWNQQTCADRFYLAFPADVFTAVANSSSNCASLSRT